MALEGGELVGTTLTWAPTPEPFEWAGQTITVPNSLPNKFDPWTYDYVIEVPESNDEITFIPTTMSTRVRSISLNGKAVGYRSRNTLPVSDGTVITVEILAADNQTTSKYTFTVAKGGPTQANADL